MEAFCRGCLNKYSEPTDLLQYCESNRRLFVYSTGLQVKRNDTFTFQLCKECYLNMKLSCKFKKQCRTSDKKFKNYLALKEVGESLDFSAYLKNIGDTLTLRFPILSSSSTPAHRRNEDDDDNVSTCTSIQNFMTDMLQGEEMPPTEARIIREVIEEEADILDDTLDSHWLEDDMSIDNDFEMDFNFSAFSTPRSRNNDHCYTPRQVTDDKEEFNYYNPKQVVEISDSTRKTQPNDMPVLDDCNRKVNDVAGNNIPVRNLETEYCVERIMEPDKQPINTSHQSDMPLLDDCNMEFDISLDSNIKIDELETGYCIESIKEHDNKLNAIKVKSQDSDNFIQSKIKEISAEEKPFAKVESFNDGLLGVSNDFSPIVIDEKVSVTNERISKEFKAPTTNKNEKIADQKVTDSPLTCELQHYINKVELKKTIRSKNNNQNQGKVDKTINQSPLTYELEKYINKAKSKRVIDSESNSSDKIVSILKGCTISANNVQQIEKKINHVILNQEETITNDESPIKRELHHYMNKVKLKKKINHVFNFDKHSENFVNGEKCSIDRNLELALKNDDSQEFSLDQLLISPQVSIRSGASTPTINNILFGSITPKEKYANDSPKLEDNEKREFDNRDFIEEFLKVNDWKRQSIKDMTSKKVKGIKDMNKLRESKVKAQFKRIKGFKDMKTHKKLLGSENLDQISEFSDNDQSDSLKDEPINIREKEVQDKTLSQFEGIEDLDVSVTSLLNFDDSQSVDLNFSISSDFLKDTETDNEPDTKENEEKDPFKRPFSPPDNKYDMENCLCKICDKKYGSIKALKIHFQKTHKLHLGKKKSKLYVPKVCHVCGRIFRDKSNLNRHLKQHKDVDPLRCQFCTLTFQTEGRLKQHMRAHTGEIARKDNMEQETNKKKIKYVCSECGKVSTNLTNFKIHQKRHTKSYTVQCNVCEKGFYRTGDLNIHMRTHTKEFAFACEHCPKAYNRRDLLMRHVLRHLGKERFKCKICEVNFVSQHKFEAHLRSIKCMLKTERRARKLQRISNKNQVTVINAVGSTETIRKLIDARETLKENNTEITEEIEIEPSEILENGLESREGTTTRSKSKPPNLEPSKNRAKKAKEVQGIAPRAVESTKKIGDTVVAEETVDNINTE